MTDLIARLEWFEEGMAECAAEGHDNPNVPWCDNCANLRDKRDMLLADNLPAIIRALKVQQAAETGVRADERREMQKAVAEAMAWSEHHRLQHGGCEWAVKGEQP